MLQPFGHSSTQASVLSSPICGFDAVYFGRISWDDRAARQNASNTEFIWRASASTGVNTQTFAGAMPGYGPPDGLCWDEVGCSNTEPIQDDPLLEDYNVPFYVDLATSTAQQWAPWHRADADGTMHLMWTMGSDFQYTNAAGWYKNLDKLIHWVNQNTSGHGVNLLYSNPGTYTSYKLAQRTTWDKKTDDFFPYADSPHSMWTGYLTSRSALKAYVRATSALHQAARQMQFLAARPADTGPSNGLYRLERAMGVTQHHDGVSGTSKQHVAYDYARRLAWGREDAAGANAAALRALAGAPGAAYATCDLANATICAPLEAGVTTVLTAWNSRGQALAVSNFRVPVALPAGVASYAVTNASGAALVAQLLPASPADTQLRTAYYGVPAGAALAWLVWQASLPAAGYATFTLTPRAAAPAATHASAPAPLAAANATITNGVVTLTLDAATGLVTSYASAAVGGGAPVALAQSWGFYNSSMGFNAPDDGVPGHLQASGAYIFRPNTPQQYLLPIDGAGAPAPAVLTGPVVSEVRSVVGSGWLTQVTRLWAGAAWAEIEYTVGPIPAGAKGTGKEVVTRFAAPALATAGAWATDSNCREMVPRKRASRSTWDYNASYEPVAGEYGAWRARAARSASARSAAALLLAPLSPTQCPSPPTSPPSLPPPPSSARQLPHHRPRHWRQRRRAQRHH